MKSNRRIAALLPLAFSLAFSANAEKNLAENKQEEIEVSINNDGNKVTKKITVNGKELNEAEIKEFEASGKMKVLHLQDRGNDTSAYQVMIIDSEDSTTSDMNVEVIMDKLERIKNGSSTVKVWKSEDGSDIKIIKKELHINEPQGASLGIVANDEKEGWHLTQVIKGSGAADAGLKKGDIVKKIANVDLSYSSGKNNNIQQLPKFEEGQKVKVIIDRDGKSMTLNVEARALDQSEMLIGLGEGDKYFQWLERLHEGSDLSKEIKVMVFEGDEFKMNNDDIHMLMPKDLQDINVFITDGKSTSKLLGKNHEMSSLSADLGKYFNTKEGVLVLNVDATNAFKLKDGDVIKSVNGQTVKTPKEVIKQLLQTKKQENIILEIVRHKKNKTLKYQK